MHRSGREVRSWTDYILGTDSCLFQNVLVRDARHNTYYYLVLGCLCRAKPAAHLRSLWKRTRLPIRTPATPDKSDRMFDEIRRAIPKPAQKERHHQAWISPDTWSLIDTSMEVFRRRDQWISQDLARAIKAALHWEWRRWAAESG